MIRPCHPRKLPKAVFVTTISSKLQAVMQYRSQTINEQCFTITKEIRKATTPEIEKAFSTDWSSSQILTFYSAISKCTEASVDGTPTLRSSYATRAVEPCPRLCQTLRSNRTEPSKTPLNNHKVGLTGTKGDGRGLPGNSLWGLVAVSTDSFSSLNCNSKSDFSSSTIAVAKGRTT